MRSLVFVMLICLVLAALPVAHSSAVTGVPVQVEQFTVQGHTGDGTQLSGSSTGVQFGGSDFNIFMMYYWTQEFTSNGAYIPGYVVYLVSVTPSDFKIGYLYLKAGTHQKFEMYYYDYNVGQVQHLYFSGTQTVTSSLSMTYTTPVPAPTFTPEAKFSNQVAIQASNVNLQGNTGTYDGQQDYVVWNYMNILNEWDEVWTVTSNYHFVVFYTYYNYPKSVTIDDLDLATAKITIATVPATWNSMKTTQPLQPTPFINTLTTINSVAAPAISQTTIAISLQANSETIMNDGSTQLSFTVSGFAAEH